MTADSELFVDEHVLPTITQQENLVGHAWDVLREQFPPELAAEAHGLVVRIDIPKDWRRVNDPRLFPKAGEATIYAEVRYDRSGEEGTEEPDETWVPDGFEDKVHFTGRAAWLLLELGTAHWKMDFEIEERMGGREIVAQLDGDSLRFEAGEPELYEDWENW